MCAVHAAFAAAGASAQTSLAGMKPFSEGRGTMGAGAISRLPGEGAPSFRVRELQKSALSIGQAGPVDAWQVFRDIVTVAGQVAVIVLATKK